MCARNIPTIYKPIRFQCSIRPLALQDEGGHPPGDSNCSRQVCAWRVDMRRINRHYLRVNIYCRSGVGQMCLTPSLDFINKWTRAPLPHFLRNRLAQHVMISFHITDVAVPRWCSLFYISWLQSSVCGRSGLVHGRGGVKELFNPEYPKGQAVILNRSGLRIF